MILYPCFSIRKVQTKPQKWFKLSNATIVICLDSPIILCRFAWTVNWIVNRTIHQTLYNPQLTYRFVSFLRESWIESRIELWIVQLCTYKNTYSFCIWFSACQLCLLVTCYFVVLFLYHVLPCRFYLIKCFYSYILASLVPKV